MITNKSPRWPGVMSELEHEDPIRTNQELMQVLADIARSHVTAEFLEATMEIPCEHSNGSTGNGNANADPFYLTPAERSALHARSTSRTGQPPLDAPIELRNYWWLDKSARKEWWAEQSENIPYAQDEQEYLDDMYDRDEE